jgi:acyl-CoA hydrolase
LAALLADYDRTDVQAETFGRVVPGVGGQYNFVAMAHALHEARSVLMLRATRCVRRLR